MHTKTTHIFLTIFPNLIKPYYEDSILSRAIKDDLLALKFFNPRDFTKDKHKKTDDYQAGGGAGLVMTPQPMFDAIESVMGLYDDIHIVFCTPVAKKFTQNDAKRLSKYKNLLFVCGRYEGIDERVYEKYADELFSIGDFVLTGGELAATVMSDAICRNIHGVLGSEESLAQESFEDGILESPSFAKPTLYEGSGTPSILLKGNHARMADFKRVAARLKTSYHRPDLFKKHTLRT